MALYELGEKYYLEKLMDLIVKTKDEHTQEIGIRVLNRYITRGNFRTILDFFLSKKTKKFDKFTKKEIKRGVNLIHKRYPRLLKNPTAGKKL